MTPSGDAGAMPSANDVAAASALLQALAAGATETDSQRHDTAPVPLPQLRDGVAAAIATLAEEARHLSLDTGSTATKGLWLGAVDDRPYDEMRDDDGVCRPAYNAVVQVFDQVLEREPQRINEFPAESLKGFRGDNKLYHIPRMLTQSEGDTLVRGIAQRARALRHFVIDIHTRRGAAFRVDRLDCVKKNAIPEDVLRRVAARAGEKWVQNLMGHGARDSQQLYWSMWYGPDIIRSPDGEGGHCWHVVEDNLGYVGGFGDLELARKVLLGKTKAAKGFPELKTALGKDQTEKFYDELAAHYLRHVSDGERVALLYYPRGTRDDNEDRRVVQLFQRRGVVAVELPGKDGIRKNQPHLVVRDGRVFVVTPEVVKSTKVVKSDDESRDGRQSPTKQQGKGAEEAKEAGTARSRSRGRHRLNRKSLSPAKATPLKSNTGLEAKAAMQAILGGGGDAGRSTRSPKPMRPSPSPCAKRARVAPQEDGEAKVETVQPAKEEPVGLVIFMNEPCDAQPGHESTKLRTAIADARSRIEDYEELQKKEELKGMRAEVAVVKIDEKVDFIDTAGDSHSLRMEAGKLLWTITEKKNGETSEFVGPFSWNRKTCTLSGGKGASCKPTTEAKVSLEKGWTLSDRTVNAEKARASAHQLRTAVEAVGQLVGGRENSSARRELFRLLRVEDKEGWQHLMKKQGVPGLLDAYYAGTVKIANGPGFELIGDKELCAHVDGLIKFYLQEEPILRTIPTLSFATKDPGSLIRTVFDDPQTQPNVVVKRVDGRGGDAVWVGAKLSPADFRVARRLVEAEPESFIVQKYTALSQVDGQMVDLRGPCFFCSSDVNDLSGGPGAGVSPVLWGRGVPAEGSNGKVNISDRGFEFAIAISPDA